MRAALPALLTLALVLACVPDVDVDESRLAAPRLHALRATPADTAPGEAVRFVALYAGAAGALEHAPLEWAYCTARKPLAELGPVASACLAQEGDTLVPIGTGLDVSGAVPSDACRLFGPEPPPAEDGASAGRPVDPDVTGGYAQPVRVAAPTDGEPEVSFFELRLACGLFGANQEQAADFRRRYRRNEPPALEALELVRDDGTADTLGEAPVTVAAGSTIVLRARWPECPRTDACGDGLCGIDESVELCADDCRVSDGPTLRGCGGAERYLRFDVATRTLAAERESLRLAWYASDGAFALERTGVTGEALENASDNVLTLPDVPGDVFVAVVVRDARGGTGWSAAHLRVEEVP